MQTFEPVVAPRTRRGRDGIDWNFYLFAASFFVETLVDLRDGLRVRFAPLFDGGGSGGVSGVGDGRRDGRRR